MTPSSFPFRILSRDSVADWFGEEETICFSSLFWVDQSGFAGESGLFAHPEELHLLRAAAYKHYNVMLPERRYHVSRVLFATPKGVEIAGMEEIREYFKKNGVVFMEGVESRIGGILKASWTKKWTKLG